MLKLFRHKNVVKMVLWGLLILILPSFVFWGIGSSSGSKKAPAGVGKINGKKVSFDEFANSITSVRCQILLKYYDTPKVLSSLLNNKPFMGRLAWDRLIMLKEAKKHNMRVADKDVINSIRSHPIFSRDGKFDEKFYGYLLKNVMGLDPRKFEEQMRENIAINMLNESITKDIKVTDEEIKESYKKEIADYDEEKLKKEKDVYSKKILNDKKEKFLANWLRELELKTTLDIDLNDYDKYYR